MSTETSIGGGTQKSSKGKPGYVLEQGKRLSESILWQLSRQYYSRKGLAAWECGTVPYYATSNPYIAQAYANLVWSFLRDCVRASAAGAAPALDPTQPIYIVELAAGSGRFSFLFLKKLLELKNASSLKSVAVRFVMTDIAEANLRGWQEQPRFRPLVESGTLDFALFNMEQSERIELQHSGEVLAPGTVRNPLVVLGNYALDSATQDIFRFAEGQSAEGLLTTTARGSEPPDITDTELLPRLKLGFEYRDFTGSYYGDPDLDRILEHYRGRLTGTTVLFPIGPLRCIKRLLDLAPGRLLLLSSDMGCTDEEELKSMPDEKMIRFYGAAATPVNYHAIGQYFRNRGGQAVFGGERLGSLKTAAFLLGGDAEQLADTRLAFAEHIDRFGPGSFFSLVSHLPQSLQNITIELLLNLLRLSCWDPHTFMSFKHQLPGQVHFASRAASLELETALTKVWENFHPLDGDLPFELLRVYLAMNQPSAALRFGELSLRLFGEHPATWYNLGLCHYKLSDFAEALRCFERSLLQKPDAARVQLWRAHARTEMALSPDVFLPTADKE